MFEILFSFLYPLRKEGKKKDFLSVHLSHGQISVVVARLRRRFPMLLRLMVEDDRPLLLLRRLGDGHVRRAVRAAARDDDPTTTAVTAAGRRGVLAFPRRRRSASIHLGLGAVDAQRSSLGRQEAATAGKTVNKSFTANAQPRPQTGADGKGVNDRRRKTGGQEAVFPVGMGGGQRPRLNLRPEAGTGDGAAAAGGQRFPDGKLHDDRQQRPATPMIDAPATSGRKEAEDDIVSSDTELQAGLLSIVRVVVEGGEVLQGGPVAELVLVLHQQQ